MIRLLRFLTWRHFLRHRLRTFLTLVGIVLGVAVIVAIAVVNRTLLVSFQRTIDLVAGKAVLQVANGESGFRESLFPAIRDTPGVVDAAAAVEGFLPVVGFKGEKLFVYGVDLLTDFTIREHQFVGAPFGLEQALDFIAQQDSIAVTESFSTRLGLGRGSEITLATSRGARKYTVRALLKEQGTAKAFGGSFALMDLPVAQMTFGKEGKLDIVDLTLEEGEEIVTVKERIQRRLHGAALVERPRERGEQVELLLTSFRVGLFFVSLVALFVGFFLIYNTVSVSVIQRKREIGTLRCLGILRRDVLILFMLEVLVIALLGSLTGVLVGILLAQAALFFVAETVSNLFFQIDSVNGMLTLQQFWIALGSGLGVSAFAGIYPAWEATQVTPLENHRQINWNPRPDRISRVSILGILLFVISLLIGVISPLGISGVEKFVLGIVAIMIFLLGLSFLSPFFILGWVKLLWGGWFFRLFLLSWVEGKLAIDGLRRSLIRSGITVATLMISLAAIFTIAAFVNSVRGSLLSWVDQMVTADLIVHSGARTAGPINVPLKENLLNGLKTIPGVQVVDRYRLIRSSYRNRPIFIGSFSARTSESVRRLPMVTGDAKKTLRRMAAGEGVVVSESFQNKFSKGLGDTIRLPTPSGLISFPVIGVYVDYSSDAGSVLVDRALYSRIWHDDLVDAFDLWLTAGADKVMVIQNIKENYGDKYQLFISTHGELRDNIVEIMEQSFNVNFAVEIVAVIVAILSVINTLLASVLDRTREMGVLRAIGATQHQLRMMVVAEAGWIGIIGGVMGVFAGTVMAYHHVVYNTKALTGWTFQFYYPYGTALLCLTLTVVLCLLAGYVPAKQAASTSIVEAIGYE